MPVIWEMAAKVESEHGIVCRNFRKKDLEAEVERFLEVYNAAWERNWDFVPLNDRRGAPLRPGAAPDPRRALVHGRRTQGHRRGRRRGDDDPRLNQVLARMRPRGRLLPFGWLRHFAHAARSTR